MLSLFSMKVLHIRSCKVLLYNNYYLLTLKCISNWSRTISFETVLSKIVLCPCEQDKVYEFGMVLHLLAFACYLLVVQFKMRFFLNALCGKECCFVCPPPNFKRIILNTYFIVYKFIQGTSMQGPSFRCIMYIVYCKDLNQE